jgi:hypothetical protein
MTVQLDHTIVPARDKKESASFLAEILGLPEPVPTGPFIVVQIAPRPQPRLRGHRRRHPATPLCVPGR